MEERGAGSSTARVYVLRQDSLIRHHKGLLDHPFPSDLLYYTVQSFSVSRGLILIQTSFLCPYRPRTVSSAQTPALGSVALTSAPPQSNSGFGF